MPSPDPTDLIRLLSGESVFDLDTNSKILNAANEVSGRAMVELFKQCDADSPTWPEDFAEALVEISTGDPSVLIGFDDCRRQGMDIDLDDLLGESDSETSAEHYLKLEFTNADACFYQFHLFPLFDEPFIQEVSRKRADEFQYVRIKISQPDDLLIFTESLRANHHFVKAHDSTEEEFQAAPSQAM